MAVGQLWDGFTNFHTKSPFPGEDIAVYGDGEQMRSFGYVGDAADCTIALMENNDAVGEVYNIGNEREISHRNDLAELVIKKCKKLIEHNL